MSPFAASGSICGDEYPELRWIAGFNFWLNDVQTYDSRGTRYLDVLRAWVDNGAALSDHTLVDVASGIVNRGCHDAPFEGTGGPDPCGNGELHAPLKRRKNFNAIFTILQQAWPTAMLQEQQAKVADTSLLRASNRTSPLPRNGIKESTVSAPYRPNPKVSKPLVGGSVTRRALLPSTEI